MKKRFLDRFTYPYLQKRLPENIVPGGGLSGKRVKSLQRGKGLRSPIVGFSFAGGKTPNRSPGLCLRLMRSASRLHKRGLFGEKGAWSGIDTLERGSLASASYPPSMIRLRDLQEGSHLSPHVGGSIPKGSARSSQLRPTEVWIKELADDRLPGPPGVRDAALTPQLAAFSKEGGDSIYSIFQLEEALSKQQERRPSPLLLQLMERNKLRIMYGNMANREVDRLIRRGLSTRGGLSDNLFRLLESRIDVFLCRIGFFATIPNARQWIHHGKVLINNKIGTAASHMLRPGDVVSISASNVSLLREGLAERSRELQILKGQGFRGWTATTEMARLEGISKANQAGMNKASGGRPSLRGEGFPSGPSQGREVLAGVPLGRDAPGTRFPPNFFKLMGRPRPIPGRSAQIANDARRERFRFFNLKPSNAEISFRCLTAIYLYPPQQVLLPATVDVERIVKA